MNKYFDFIEEVKGIRGLRNLDVEYCNTYDSIYLNFTDKQFKTMDNENSKMFQDFCNLVDDYGFKSEFKCYGTIEVYEE